MQEHVWQFFCEMQNKSMTKKSFEICTVFRLTENQLKNTKDIIVSNNTPSAGKDDKTVLLYHNEGFNIRE